MQSYEKLGVFYLGRRYEPERGSPTEEPLLYDAKDLTTHAVCVGMTGSGKTGLCISLLEEAAIDGIPALVIDPKGDLGNLLLTFPDLRPEDFRPWIDEGAAGRAGESPEAHAARVAETWKRGLAEWGQDGARIARFEDSADVALYTPGSSAGLPLSVFRSFAAPARSLVDDADALRSRVMAAVSGLLGLVGLRADPLRGRESILLQTLLDRAWREGRDLDLGALVREIQEPRLDKVGVIDLESFFPAAQRFELSVSLNNLMASPGFAAWMEGEPLEIQRLLWTPEGKPRLAILSIAHLSEAERMFFVTLLLNEVVAWMRGQPGTGSLRAIVYMDEVFGYFPPSAEPPSKRPMLTLLKQARAYGLGVVLSTQNPVDLDYKGLSNAGTWLLGRLQTERDKERVIEGLLGASAAAGSRLDRRQLETTLAGLKSRVFMMNNVHEDAPVLFHSRWALSYLRGPLTGVQIRALNAARPRPAPAAPGDPVTAAAKAAAPASLPAKDARPVLPPDVSELFLAASGVDADRLLYRPALLGAARLHFVRTRPPVDHWSVSTLLAPLDGDDGADPWAAAAPWTGDEARWDREPAAGAAFADPPPAAARAKSYVAWSRKLVAHAYRTQKLSLRICRALKEVSEPGETEGEFRIRLGLRARELRDADKEKLQKRYAPKLARLEERIRRAEDRVAREQSQYAHHKTQTAISIGASVLGALFGRKLTSIGNVGRATTAMRGVGRSSRERADVSRASEELERLKDELSALETEFDDAATAISADPALLDVETLELKPRKADISVIRVVLAWTPWRVDDTGIPRPAFAPAGRSEGA